MRMIDADPVEKFIEDGLNNPDKLKAFGHDAVEILAEIHCASTIDPESLRPTGEWIEHEFENELYYGTEYKCSVCGIYQFDNTNYCPNCGAKMQEAT